MAHFLKKTTESKAAKQETCRTVIISPIKCFAKCWLHWNLESTETFKNGPIPAPFCLFLSFSHHNFNNSNSKKHRWCAWDSNPRPQDGRRRRYHGAMATALQPKLLGGRKVFEQSSTKSWPTTDPKRRFASQRRFGTRPALLLFMLLLLLALQMMVLLSHCCCC